MKFNMRDPLQQTLALIFSALFAAIGLTFVAFSYYQSKNEFTENANLHLLNSLQSIEGLVQIKQREMDLKAQTILSSQSLKSALSSQHLKTIEDALVELRQTHQLDFLIIVKNKNLLYGQSQVSQEVSIKELVRGHFLGIANIQPQFLSSEDQASNLQLLVGHKLSAGDFELWQKSSQTLLSEFAFNSQIESLFFKSLRESTPLVHEKTSDIETSKKEILVTRDGRFFYAYAPLLKGTLPLYLGIDRDLMLRQLYQKRNLLIVLAGVITLLGLFFGMGLSYLLLGIFNRHQGHNQTMNFDKIENTLLRIEKLQQQHFLK